MSEDVCESWEELIVKDDMNKKLNNLDLKSCEQEKSTKDKTIGNVKNSINTKLEKNNILDETKKKSKTKINGNNPKNVKIMFEDNTRTTPQLDQKSQLKILKRPKPDNLNEDTSLKITNDNSFNAKTIQERMAEYEKARLRILGSTIPNYEENELEEINSQINKTSSVKKDNLVRQPQGPNNIKNFAQRR